MIQYPLLLLLLLQVSHCPHCHLTRVTRARLFVCRRVIKNVVRKTNRHQVITEAKNKQQRITITTINIRHRKRRIRIRKLLQIIQKLSKTTNSLEQAILIETRCWLQQCLHYRCQEVGWDQPCQHHPQYVVTRTTRSLWTVILHLVNRQAVSSATIQLFLCFLCQEMLSWPIQVKWMAKITYI